MSLREIILDSLSSRENDSTTSLSWRYVKSRGAYVSGLRGDILFISEGNGNMSSRGELVTSEEGGSYVSVHSGEGLIYGGVKSVLGGLEHEDRGVVLSWTRNDSERERFSGYELLGGGFRESLGVVGEDLGKASSLVLGGRFYIGARIEILGEGAQVVSGDLGESDFVEGVSILVGGDGSLRLKSGEFEDGDEVYFARRDLGVEGEVESLDGGSYYVAPVPDANEEIYLRVGSEGHLSGVVYFDTDEEAEGYDCGEWGACISLERGLLRVGSGYWGKSLSYEGLLLGRNVELVGDLVVENGVEIGGGDLFQAGLVNGELEGLSYGVCFLNVGGLGLVPLEFGGSVLRGDRGYVDGSGVLRVSRSLELLASRGTGVLKLVQGLVPCVMTRGVISQRVISEGLVLVGGEEFAWSNGEVISGVGLGKVWSSGHVEIYGELDSDYESYGLVASGLGTGIYLGLRSGSVNGFRVLSDEVVGELRGGSVYTFLDFVPRTDFVLGDYSYGGGNFFKAGNVLREGVDIVYDFSGVPKIGWVESGSTSRELKEPTGILELGNGLVSGSTSIKLSRGVVSEDLVEGVDYDLPFGGEAGYARLISDLSPLVASGKKFSILEGGVELLDGEVGLISEGDLFLSKKDGYYRRVLGVEGSALSLSSVEDLELGLWEVYGGQLGDLDLTRASDECFKGLALSDEPAVRLFHIYDWAGLETLNRRAHNGSVWLRDSEGVEVELLGLTREVLLDRVVPVGEREFKIFVDGELNEDWVLGEGRLLEFDPAIESTSVVLYEPIPLGGEYISEELGLPEGFEPSYLVEEVPSSSFQVSDKQGVISFNEPLSEGVGVEVIYTPEGESESVRETILFQVSFEEAVQESARKFVFSEGAYLDVSPVVYVGAESISEGYEVLPSGEINFTYDIVGKQVGISYLRLGSLGGEYFVKLSSGISLPLLSLSEGATSFVLEGRSDLSELEIGHILDFGDHCFRVSGVNGNEVSFSPASRFNLNVSSISRTNKVDLYISVSGSNLESKSKSSNVYLEGDFTSLIFEKSVLLVGGDTPYRVKKVEFLEDRNKTLVEVRGYTSGYAGVSEFLISARPVLDEGDTTLKPLGQVAEDISYDLVREENGLGMSLVSGVDYVLNGGTGEITLKNGFSVSDGVRYTLRHTAISVVSPTYDDSGALINPKYSASFLLRSDASAYVDFPLLTKCVIEARDKFKIPVVDEVAYEEQVYAFLLQGTAQTQGKREGNALPANQDGVGLGLYEPLARDVVARNKISFYNDIISSVDDLVSTSTGKVVGDADGKFRFEIEQGSVDYVASGLEDPVTRQIEPRYVTLDYFASEGIELEVDGFYAGLSTSQIRDAYRGQVSFVENEIDDYVFVGVEQKRYFADEPPFIRVGLSPVYDHFYKPSLISRLYPESTKAYTLLFDSEVYTAGREVNGEYISTRGSVIGQLENLAMGEIRNVGGLASVEKRGARFRVYDYSRVGFPELAPESANKPSLILSAVPLDDFPVVGGEIDLTRFKTLANPQGDIISVESGDADLAYQGLSVGSVLEFGRDGLGMRQVVNTLEIGEASSELFSFLTDIVREPKYVRVEGIYEGCVVVLSGKASSLKYKGSEDTFLSDPPVRGDTVLESFKQDIDSDTPQSGDYRVGVDIGLRATTGELIDISQPSISDGSFPWQEINEQNVPEPLTAIEAEVQIRNARTEIFEYPALLGQDRNDDGEYTLPFISSLSERVLLKEAEEVISKILNLSYVDGVDTHYLYPDEITTDNGNLGSDERGVLTIGESLTPYTEGETPADDVKAGDLVLISPSESFSYRGFVEVSRVDLDKVYAPRFRLPIKPSLIKYKLKNYFVSDLSKTGVGLFLKGFKTLAGDWVLQVGLDPTGSQLVFENLIDFMESASETTKNSFSISFANGAVLNFFYDGVNSDWYLFDGINGNNHVLISSVNQIGTIEGAPNNRGFEITSTSPALTDLGWDFIRSLGVPFAEFNHSTSRYEFGDLVDYTIDFNFNQNEFISSGVTSLISGGSVTAEILEDRLTFRENQDVYGSVLTYGEGEEAGAGAGELTIYSCIVENGLVFSDGRFAYYETDQNNNSVLNDDQPYYFYEVSGNELRIESIVGSGNTFLKQSELTLSVLVGSRVDEAGFLYEGEAFIGGYTLENFNSVEIEGRKNLISVGVAGDISRVMSGDLVYVSSSMSSGVHRVKSVVSEGLDDEPLTYRVGNLPYVTLVADVGGGVYEITFNKSLWDYAQDPVADGIFVLISEQEAKSATTYTTAGVEIEVASVSPSGLVVTTGGAPKNLAGVDYVESYGELISKGMSLFGVDKLPLTSRDLGISDDVLPYDIVALGVESFYANLTGAETDLTSSLELIRNSYGSVTHITFSRVLSSAPNELLILPYENLNLDVDLLKGLYIDDDFPRMGQDYGGTEINYFGSAQAYGLNTYGGASPQGNIFLVNGDVWSESATISVRRLRRFSDLNSRLNKALTQLSQVYEIRRGLVDSLVADGYEYTLTALPVDRLGNEDADGEDTQLGSFTDFVYSGDKVSIYDAEGSLALRLRVISVDGSLTCSYLSGSVPTGNMSFQIETRTAPIPQEQSFSKFLNKTTTFKYEGAQGFVDVENEIKDASGVDFTTLGVEPSDYILIDPYGVLNPSYSPLEYGAPRRGDTGRSGTTGFSAGSVNPLDDNRGVYQVISVSSDSISVEPVFTDEGFAPSGYLLTPSVQGVEGRPLRVTSEMNAQGSYADNSDSVSGFKWRVVKKSDNIGAEIFNTMLFLRERTLSWAEKVRLLGGVEDMTWETYESDNLVRFLGTEDRTYFTNDEIRSVLGEVGVYPLDINFVTSSECLSILDRRFLVESPSLLIEGYSDLGVGLPTLLESGLSFMEAREKRSSWINVRVGLLRGTLPTAERVDFTNPNLKALEDIK